MSDLRELENTSIFILREAYANFKNLCMLWSMGKDSTVLLWLTRKAFLGHVPFPLVHIDTQFKIPEMIEYRDQLTKEWHLPMVVGKNETALENKQTFPDHQVDRITCCRNLKTEALKDTLSGKCKRMKFNHSTGRYEIDSNKEALQASSSEPGLTKKVRVPKSVTFLNGMRIRNGISLNSLRNSGTSLKPISNRAPASGFILSWIGRS